MGGCSGSPGEEDPDFIGTEVHEKQYNRFSGMYKDNKFAVWVWGKDSVRYHHTTTKSTCVPFHSEQNEEGTRPEETQLQINQNCLGEDPGTVWVVTREEELGLLYSAGSVSSDMDVVTSRNVLGTIRMILQIIEEKTSHQDVHTTSRHGDIIV